MQAIKKSSRSTLIRLAVVLVSLSAWALVATPEKSFAFGSFSPWTAPGTLSTCYATRPSGAPIEGYSSVSTNALQTLMAIDEGDECSQRTEARGRDSAKVEFTQKAVTSALVGQPNSETASVTTPRNISRHRCRVEWVDTSRDPNGVACLN